MSWVGRVIDGRYAVESVIGAGGMGVVLAARHKFTGARVAVKMMRRDLGIDPEIEARFLSEARVPTAIDHRGVVKTLDGGKTPDGELYIVMELLAGQSLRVAIQRGTIGLAATRRIGMELLDVLAAAHARGIIHRDVKPENVMLVEPGGTVKLLDFGITKLLTAPHSVLPRTAAGAFLGTVAYMAPEQLADARTVDARADLWSVGVMLYELIGGRRPFRAATVEEALVALVHATPDPIKLAFPQATPDVEAFFARALARDPAQRFASAPEMAQAFARLSMLPSAPAGSLPFAAATPSPAGGLAMATQATTPPGTAAVPPAATNTAVPPAATNTDLVPRSGRRGWLVALLALVAIAGAALVVVGLRHRAATPARQPTVTALPAAPVAAPAPPAPAPAPARPVVAKTTPPAPRPPPAAAAPRESPAPAPASPGPHPVDPYAAAPPPAPAVDLCTAGCKLLESCHLGTRSCQADCAGPGLLHTCLEHAGNDCNRFAACWFAASCSGAAPAGGHSCSEAMDCEASCQQDQGCLCTCIAGLAPARAATLLGYNGCVLPCRDDVSCIAQHCDAQARRCRAQ